MVRCLFDEKKSLCAVWIFLLFLPLAVAQGQSLPQQTTIAVQNRYVKPMGSRTAEGNASMPNEGEDRGSRIEAANSLKKMGEVVDWQKYDLLTLIDMQSRAESAQHLKQLGVVVNWRKYDSSTLSDMEMRVEAAQQLDHLGIKVDWHKYDMLTLMDMQTLADTLQRLQQKSIALEWHRDGVNVTLAKPSSGKVAMQTARPER